MEINLGKKIKKLRKEKGMTQADLAKGRLTRNMISCIESGAANPSLKTLEFISEGLGVSISYLLSEDDDTLFYEKKDKISRIYRAFDAKNYQSCINLIKSCKKTDNELDYILASAYLEHAKNLISRGSLVSAELNLKKALEHCEKTALKTEHIESEIPLYLSIARNIQSPLLEFDTAKYISHLNSSVSFEFFKYLTLDFEYSYETPVFALHIEAKKLMKDHNYSDASKLLLNVAELTKKEGYNAFVVFSVYTDLEYCYKQLYDFEKAYLYSTKRLTLLDSFKS